MCVALYAEILKKVFILYLKIIFIRNKYPEQNKSEDVLLYIYILKFLCNYTYDAFGNAYEGNFLRVNEIGYNGKRLDSAVNLYNYGFRDMSPMLGRFTTVDPIKDGNNWYVYCLNNPILYIDPFGLDVNITITNDIVGKGELRNDSPGSKKTVTVPTYKVVVTDDVTKTKSYYQVTRQSVFDSDTQTYGANFTFEPDGDTKTFRGLLSEKEGVGRVIYLYENNDQRQRGDLYRSDTGETNDAFIEIHVGGYYYNTVNKSYGWATSWGCFALNGPDAGDKGRDKFMDDVEKRLEAQTKDSGQKILITVEKSCGN